MDTNIKQLTITGQAAEDFGKSRRPSAGGSRRKRSVKSQDEEFNVEDDELVSKLKQVAITKAQEQTPIVKVPTVTQAQPIQKPPETPTEPQKVILKPPRQQRVKLQPKAVAAAQPSSVAKPVVNQTRKARRIKLTMANLNHRFTRAKKVKETTEKESLDTIRDFLVNKGVIQSKSKAPEKMLRSMYSDFMLLKDQAL